MIEVSSTAINVATLGSIGIGISAIMQNLPVSDGVIMAFLVSGLLFLLASAAVMLHDYSDLKKKGKRRSAALAWALIGFAWTIMTGATVAVFFS